MPDLWQVLGYGVLLDQLSDGLAEPGHIQLISGPAGAGKSWLGAKLGRRWEAAHGVGLTARGDPGRGDSAYYPFNYALGDVSTGWRTAAPLVYDAGRMAETFIGTGGTLTATIQALSEIPTKRRQRHSHFLGEAAQQVLHNLERRSKKRPTLLIADDVHYWDSASLDLLRNLLSADMRETFPFLDRLRVVAIETPPPQQAARNPAALNTLIASGWTRRVKLHRPPRERFLEVLLSLGAPEDLDRGTADEVYTLTNAHLLLARHAADYMALHGVAAVSAATDAEDFKRMLLTYRLHSFGDLERATLELLQVASVLGLTFRQEEILCASGHHEGETRRILHSCREENVLDLSEQTYRFVHDLVRQFFGDIDLVDRVSIHEQLLSCIRFLRPGDYSARSVTALGAERPGEAGVLAVQAALQIDREGRDWRDHLVAETRSAVQAASLSRPLDLLVAARAALSRYEFAECLTLLGSLPHGLAESLRAEADYLRAMSLMSTRSEDDRAAGRELLRPWEGFETKEPELGLRMMRQLLYGLAMLRDKTEARELERRIRHALKSRAEFDPSAVDDLYTLDRCSGALDEPDLALTRTREAVHHFGPQPGDTMIRRPLEYYRCLVNYGANLICNAEYAQAVHVHEDLSALVSDFDDGVFPRVDYALANGVLARYRHGALTAEDAAARQREIVVRYGSEADPFYGFNALAVYLVLAGHFTEALAIFDDMAERLKTSRRQPEPSMQYLVGANRVAARFVAGVASDAANAWEELASLLPQIAYTTAKYLERRHELLSSVFEAAEPIDPVTFDRYAIAQDLDGSGPLWDNYGRGFRLPEIEFWRES